MEREGRGTAKDYVHIASQNGVYKRREGGEGGREGGREGEGERDNYRSKDTRYGQLRRPNQVPGDRVRLSASLAT